MKKIMYLTTVNSTFIQRDVEMLKEDNEVFHLWRKMSSDIRGALNFITFHFQFLCSFWKYDIIMSRFVGYHTLIPFCISTIFRKKTVAILGGTGCHLFPEINYGSLRRRPLSVFTYYSIKIADLLLPVHESLILHKYSYLNTKYKNQGIFGLRPKLNQKKYKVIHNGFNSNEFVDLGMKRESKSFITIVSDLNSVNYKLKGIDLIVELAKNRPDLKFYIIGSVNYKFDYSSNITFLGRMGQKDLVYALNTKQFYIQVSIAEGFPNALCESMLCGCIPIGSDVFSIPEIIDDTGIVLKSRDSFKLSSEIDVLLNKDLEKLRENVRKRIIGNYSLNLRKSEFVKTLDSL